MIIGVVGAGTMGAGIAQLAAESGARTWLHDPDPDALEHGVQRARARLRGGGAVEPAPALSDLAACGLVIEAAPESLELKRALFAELAQLVAPDCVLATNTSSLSVTAIAREVPSPERVVGMHFFNPAPVMRLLEVVAGDATGETALAVARATGEAMGKRVIDAADSVGFLVNRCNRPFGLEAMRIVEQGIATPEQVDRICRMGGGFRMGPFELADLVGIDVGLEVSKSFWERSFHEPRWRPSPLAARLVDAGRLGRKTGRGWYRYDGDAPHRPPDPEPPPVGGGDGRLVVVPGLDPLASELKAAAAAAGWRVAEELGDEPPFLCLDWGDTAPDHLPTARACEPFAASDHGGRAVGFLALAPLAESRLVELSRTPATSSESERSATGFFGSLGKHVEWVADSPGLVLGRIVAALVNEAHFAVGEGVGTADDVDAGMTLGLNHPRGPFAWGEAIGPNTVLGILRGVGSEYSAEVYRAAPALARAAGEAWRRREET